MKITNFGKNNIYNNIKLFKPKNVDHIMQIVRNSKRVRVLGSSHSWSKHYDDCINLISLKEYFNYFYFNHTKCFVRCGAGALVYNVQRYLMEKGYVLRSSPQSKDATIGGIIANAVHGQNGPVFSDNVLYFKIVDPKGNKKIITEKDGDLFRAYKCSLGLLGVVYEVGLKVDILRNVELSVEEIDIKNFKHLAKYILNKPSIRPFFVYTPYHNRLFMLKFQDKKSRTTTITRTRTRTTSKTLYFNKQIFTLVFGVLSMFVPFIVKLLFFITEIPYCSFIWRLIHLFMIWIFKGLEYLTDFYKISINDEFLYPVINHTNTYNNNFLHHLPTNYYESEYAIDLCDIEKFFKKIKKLDTKKYSYQIPFPMRIVKGDNNTLIAPTNQRNSIYISYFWFPSFFGIKSFAFRTLFKKYVKVMESFKGRPHWGKLMDYKFKYIKSTYPPNNIKKFTTILKDTDQEGKFKNTFTNVFLK